MQKISTSRLSVLAALAIFAVTSAWAQKAMKKDAVIWPAEDIKWVAAPDAPGVMYADLWGHMEKGAYAAFVKIPAAVKFPLHTHSADLKAVVVSGIFIYTPEGGTEKKLGAGSYMFIPGGLKHTSAVAEGAPCILFQEGSSKFDLKPVGAEKEKK